MGQEGREGKGRGMGPRIREDTERRRGGLHPHPNLPPLKGEGRGKGRVRASARTTGGWGWFGVWVLVVSRGKDLLYWVEQLG